MFSFLQLNNLKPFLNCFNKSIKLFENFSEFLCGQTSKKAQENLFSFQNQVFWLESMIILTFRTKRLLCKVFQKIFAEKSSKIKWKTFGKTCKTVRKKMKNPRYGGKFSRYGGQNSRYGGQNDVTLAKNFPRYGPPPPYRAIRGPPRGGGAVPTLGERRRRELVSKIKNFY